MKQDLNAPKGSRRKWELFLARINLNWNDRAVPLPIENRKLYQTYGLDTDSKDLTQAA